MDTILTGALTTADLPADMQSPLLRLAPAVTCSMPSPPVTRCEHGWLRCLDCETYTG
jgi:hypothetical protein